METRTVVVPNISCHHCTHTIQMELSELPGVKRVKADVDTKQVTVSWEAPATWDKIVELLKEINYPPAEEVAA